MSWMSTGRKNGIPWRAHTHFNKLDVFFVPQFYRVSVVHGKNNKINVAACVVAIDFAFSYTAIPVTMAVKGKN